MIGIVIPAHNEEQYLDQCLDAALTAAAHPELDEPVRILVVLDSCSDGSASIAANYPVDVLSVCAHNVGLARAAGVEWLLSHGASWLACSDADSRVAPDWLVQQRHLNADMVCGTVQIAEWGDLGEALQARYHSAYHARDGHRHIHGANLSFSASAYRHAGGFKMLPVNEDVQLVAAFERIGARIAWSCLPQVYTSARLDCRARGGFGDYLKSLL
ncbi:glycosyltransferase [Pseudomonas seleniipraecipitans]|uniref:Glycosyltransferase n=1 Tax=Phytopseudomonas seleniipraecipitans TaxID=640205 RepID=A0ABY5JAP2_9GAMM|nr:glycosyltransferase [Pseudomonas seleniipraecipitans]UUD64700.1 glycosyltransferase [Pseudomonas seleniipraecipitans]